MKPEIIPIFVLSLVIFIMVVIPMKITGYGFLPPDDVLGHTATVVSQKSWGDFLVLRDGIKTEHHPGWFAILRVVHQITHWDTDSLVVFSVAFLFFLFCIAPVLMLGYQEAWPLTLFVVITASPTFIFRLLLGRPYIFTMSILLALLFLWPKLRDGKIRYFLLMVLAVLIAASTWIHGSWYLFALPILSFFLAREWRVGCIAGLCTIAGTIIGASLTGHPFLFIKESLYHMSYTIGTHNLQRVLVGELQPYGGDVLVAITVLGMLIWRKIDGAWDKKVIDNPVFILAALGWVLGFIARRFWLDWGMPAVCVWMTLEFQRIFNAKIDFLSWKRLIFAMVIIGTFYIVVASDINSRWTLNLTTEYLSLDNHRQAPWLPEPGGIIYSDDMTIFYQTFFKNPHAPWRYILGFEPTMMPKEDLDILRKIQWNFGAYEAFEPWVKKMRPQDRLIIRRPAEMLPRIPGLEWYYAATGIWIGRPRR